MRNRAFAESDLEALLELFRAAVEGLAAECYDAAQRAAWAPPQPDRDAWRRRLGGQHCSLAVDAQDRLLGFIAYDGGGHVDLLYTAPEQARNGVARALYEHAERTMIGRGAATAFTEASRVARPFFERCGFRVTEPEQVSVRSQQFQRYRMLKVLSAS